MTKYCALIGRKKDGGKDDLPGVRFFGRNMIKKHFLFGGPLQKMPTKNAKGGGGVWYCPKNYHTLCCVEPHSNYVGMG